VWGKKPWAYAATTGAWDVVLRLFAERRVRLFGIEDWRWVAALRPYFAKHTVLSAALVAGFVGALTCALSLATPGVQDWSYVPYVAWVVLLSVLIGQLMRFSGLFPHLTRYYYDELGFAYTLATDGLSAIIVCFTMLAYRAVVHRPGPESVDDAPPPDTPEHACMSL
jgi:hypothetical protein